jgi:hypothetical protein
MNSKTTIAADAHVSAPTPKNSKTAVTLGDLADRYIKHLEDDGKSPGTLSSYMAELKLAIKQLGGDTKIADITTERVGEYFDSEPVTKLRSGGKKAQPSVDKSRRVLRLALVWAAEQKWIAVAPIPEPSTKG